MSCVLAVFCRFNWLNRASEHHPTSVAFCSAGHRRALTHCSHSTGLPVANSYLNLEVGNSTMTEDVLRVLGNRILANAGSLALDHGVGKVAKRIEDGKPVEASLRT